jgi:tripartite-type tricarboxylate transporter receptor subunit TctC
LRCAPTADKLRHMSLRTLRARRRGLLLSTLAAPALAQGGWAPDRQIRWLVPYGAGGPTDSFARAIGRAMGARLGQNVLVDNRPGGGGVLATEMAVRAPADGHTLLLVDNGIVVYAPALFARLPYDPDAELAGIGFIARFPLLLVVREASPWRDFAGFAAAARARAPTYGTGAVASPQHLAMEFLARQARFDATHVPYRNSPAALQDMLAGAVDFMLTDSASAVGALRQGQARALLVMSPVRAAVAPDAPTTAELGLPAALASAWMGMSVPAATPGAARTRLNVALAEAVASEEVAAMVRNVGAEAVPGGPGEFDAAVRAEAARWRPLIRELGIRLD